MSYELRNDEGVNELLDFAGGLTVNAYTGLIQVENIEENSRTNNSKSNALEFAKFLQKL